MVNKLIQEKSLVYFWYIVRAQYQLAITTLIIAIIITIEVGHFSYKNLSMLY